MSIVKHWESFIKHCSKMFTRAQRNYQYSTRFLVSCKNEFNVAFIACRKKHVKDVESMLQTRRDAFETMKVKAFGKLNRDLENRKK